MVVVEGCNHCAKCCQVDVGFGVDEAGFCRKYDRDASRCAIYDNGRPQVCLNFPHTPGEFSLCEPARVV